MSYEHPRARGNGRKASAVPDDLKPVVLTAIDTNTQEWVPFPIPQLGVELSAMPLIDDPDTGMQVLKLVYRAGTAPQLMGTAPSCSSPASPSTSTTPTRSRPTRGCFGPSGPAGVSGTRRKQRKIT